MCQELPNKKIAVRKLPDGNVSVDPKELDTYLTDLTFCLTLSDPD